MDEYLDAIVPHVGGNWKTDEIYLRVKGNEKFLFSMLDSGMRFWLSVIVANKGTSDAVPIFEATEKLAGKKPGILILGEAVNFHETWRDMWRAKNPL